MSADDDAKTDDSRSPCPDCGGTGKGGDIWTPGKADPAAPCDYCQGRGWVKWS